MAMNVFVKASIQGKTVKHISVHHVIAILVLMALSRTLIQPIISYYFYWRGISPGLADLKLVLNIDLDLLMIGLIFFVIAKIMERASEINEENQLTI